MARQKILALIVLFSVCFQNSFSFPDIPTKRTSKISHGRLQQLWTVEELGLDNIFDSEDNLIQIKTRDASKDKFSNGFHAVLLARFISALIYSNAEEAHVILESLQDDPASLFDYWVEKAVMPLERVNKSLDYKDIIQLVAVDKITQSLELPKDLYESIDIFPLTDIVTDPTITYIRSLLISNKESCVLPLVINIGSIDNPEWIPFVINKKGQYFQYIVACSNSTKNLIVDSKLALFISILEDKTSEIAKNAQQSLLDKASESLKERKAENQEFYSEEYPKINFSDLAGINSQILEKSKKIINFIKHFKSLKSNGISRVPDAAIFFGPAGTGKSSLARAIAGEANAACLIVNAQDLYDRYYGQSVKNWKKVVARAREIVQTYKIPVVIVIEEVDGVTKKDSKSDLTFDIMHAINAELGHKTANEGIFFIATTNKFDDLHETFRTRCSGYCINMGNYDFKDRLEVIRLYVNRLNLLTNLSEKDLCYIAKKADGLNPRELESMIVKAAITIVMGSISEELKSKYTEINKDLLLLCLQDVKNELKLQEAEAKRNKQEREKFADLIDKKHIVNGVLTSALATIVISTGGLILRPFIGKFFAKMPSIDMHSLLSMLPRSNVIAEPVGRGEHG